MIFYRCDTRILISFCCRSDYCLVIRVCLHWLLQHKILAPLYGSVYCEVAILLFITIVTIPRWYSNTVQCDIPELFTVVIIEASHYDSFHYRCHYITLLADWLLQNDILEVSLQRWFTASWYSSIVMQGCLIQCGIPAGWHCSIWCMGTYCMLTSLCNFS
jgi:hypothetical protein